MPKVSVIIPIYNVEKYLDKCLDSIVNQTYENIEIICINDGSTDGSQKIVNKYKKKYKNIISLEKENGGQATARNMGLTIATGEYVTFVDSDDYIDKKLYETIAPKMKKGYDLILFDYEIVYSNRRERKYCLNPIDKDNVTPSEYLLSQIVSPCNKIYKKAYLDKMNFKFPEGIIYEDYAAIPTLVINNPKIAYVDKAFYFYVQSDSSTTRNEEYKTKYENLFPATEFLYNKLKNCELKEEAEYQITIHNLYHGALNFYKFNKLEQIDKIADSIKEKFPKWNKNKYIKKESLRAKTLMYLFYKKRYWLIKLIQKLKNRGAR